ncbi:hypothetical protein L873DRAFT_1790861 [Choiromyces venosus 120613-1]|uniref:Uncharacterized protein n=1 Tax=Choiromyces venosus 120613-1 TaxID=1336337 RepID=A0A3N4JGU8_9PEZI|nr:hypothetical protein L873DRAFT_1790861 [Choiromyces venosus 120613-1]
MTDDQHIQDSQVLKDEVANLSSKVVLLEIQLQYQTTTPPSTLPPLQQQQQPPTWAQKVAKSLSSKPSTTPPNKIALPAVLTKCDHTIVIERDRTALPDNTNTLTIHDETNSAIKKTLIATIEFTTNYHVLLITKDNTPTTSVLKHYRFAIEEAIRATIPGTITLTKEKIWHKVILYSIPTTSSFTTIEIEIEEFNPGTHLARLSRWLTIEAQCQDKAASAMILTIASKDSIEKALSKGLSLFSRKFKVEHYLIFGPDIQ